VRDDDWPVLPGERRVRFGCGALFGLAVGLSLGTVLTGAPIAIWLFVAGVAVVFGLGAAAFGDSFWRIVGGWKRWFRP
jgi:hypothetical protein